MKINITIDIYSDIICPWCYIGFKKLKFAIVEFPNIKFDLIWRPFQLNPRMSLEGMDRKKYLETKFNGKDNASRAYKSAYEEGLKNDIYFQFDKIYTTPNTFSSHKLLALAYKFEKQTEVVETLFYDYFIEGVDIGSLDELIRIAKQHNLSSSDNFKYLSSKEDSDNLLAEEGHARELGIKGVPCFIINKQFILFGAQDKKNFIDIFNKISK